MKPYYQDGAVTIYHGSCREREADGLTVNAVVTDPPFGIGWDRATWSDRPADYPELMAWLVAESQRVTQGWNFVFQAMPNVGRFHEWFPDGWRIFAACKNFAQIRPTGVWHSWDPVVFWHNGAPDDRSIDAVKRDYHVGDVAGVFGERVGHPCPKPMDTMRHIVALACQRGGTVYDPFCGSGTTLRAAKDLGRKAIGIEIEERYCEIAAKRCAQEVLSL